ncbi:hypothetical protein HJC23_012462 [Cyclotella cryptica]|uniref:Uncharacterized protein n=1 Tax=Cyclotella cryptica TaxID=29204 RepID=A0ABD3P6Y0_9STRA
MKSLSYLLMLLSLASSCTATTMDPQPNNSRDLKMTQAQRFASVMNPRATSMEQFKTQLKNKQDGVGSGSNSKLSLVLGEALSLKGGGNGAEDVSGGHGDRTTIKVDKSGDGTSSSRPKDKAKKDKESNGSDGDSNNVFISKFSAALGEAMNNNNNRDVGGGTEKNGKTAEEQSDMEGRSSALPQGS